LRATGDLGNGATFTAGTGTVILNGGGAQNLGNWLPVGTGTGNFVGLPPEVTNVSLVFEVIPNDGRTGPHTSLLEIPSIDGYDAFRAIPEDQLTCPSCAVAAGVLPRVIVSN
jgi:hypothetical protein